MKTILLAGLIAVSGAVIPLTAVAQSTQTRDISAQLQSGLESAAPVVVYFDFDEDVVKSDAKAILDRQATWLIANRNAKVDLAGHTDAVGSNSYNDDLAMRRANAVQAYLFERGVNANQMRSVVSRGESELVVQTAKKERLNRRVTTGVTGLVVVQIAAPVEFIPVRDKPSPRQYTETGGDLCIGSSGAQLAGFSAGDSLKAELTSRMNRAASLYSSAAVQDSTNHIYNLASFTKVECGIAIGYVKNGIADKRSIRNCECFADQLPKG